MTIFPFLLAASAAVIIALGFVLWPLLSTDPETRRRRRRLEALDELAEELDPEDYRQRRARLQQALSGSGSREVGAGLLIGLALAVPLATWLLYQTVGEPAGLVERDDQLREFRSLLVGIAHELERNPDNPEYWARLGMIYKEIAEFSSAEHAFRRALYIDDDNLFLKVELAETLLFASQGPRLPAESAALLADAIAIDPNNQKGLWLLGIGAFQSGDYSQALNWWQRLEAQLPAGTVRQSVSEQIARARAQLDDSAAAFPPGHPPLAAAPAESADGPGLIVDLGIAPELQAGLSGSEVVFVIARAYQGPAAPLAVQRLSVADLPTRVTLRDSDAMVEGLNLSAFPEISLIARISMNGGVDARPGDLEGRTGPVDILETAAASVLIDRRIPAAD